MRSRVGLVLTVLVFGSASAAIATDPPTLTQITHSEPPYLESVPFSISDDGRWLVWGRGDVPYATTWRLITSDSEGGHQVELGTIHTYLEGRGDCRGVSMSGDGRLVAFASVDDLVGANPHNICQIYVVGRDGSNLRQLTMLLWGISTEPALNSDGSVLVCTSGTDSLSYTSVVKIRVSDGARLVLDDPPRNGCSRNDPSIDAAGDRLAYQYVEWIPFHFYYGARAARSDGDDLHDFVRSLFGAGTFPGVMVSRDGGTVLYTSTGDYTGENPHGADPYDPAVQAFVMPWEGGPIRQISDGTTVRDTFASRQPMTGDGSRAAFQIFYNGNEECSMTWIDTSTRATEDIVPRSAEACLYGAPLASGDGRVLAFTSARVSDENPDGHYQVYVFRYPAPQTGSAPVASAGPDQVLECEGARRATASLDGSASSDADSTPGTNDDIATFAWSEGGTALGEGMHASVALSLGPHAIDLAVTDRAGRSAQDRTEIDVVDALAPAGVIVAPAAGSCVGPASLPVTVADDFTDLCDQDVTRSYAPGPGPSYVEHGDHEVVLSVADTSGNVGTASVSFVIDTVPPAVTIVPPGPLGAVTPPVIQWLANDEDGATGGVVAEIVQLQGCTIFDGRTYGDRDGLLSDETLTLTNEEMCRIAAVCGFSTLEQPTLRVEAIDCGGNVGASSLSLAGSVALRPGLCGGGLKSSAVAVPRKRHRS